MGSVGIRSGKLKFGVATARQKFLRLTSREKLLIILVLGVVAYYWIDNHTSRQSRTWSQVKLANGAAATQQSLLNEEPKVRALWEAAIAEIPMEELPTRDEVQGKLDQLVRNYAGSTRFNLRAQKPEIGDPLTFHTFQLDVSRIGHEPLMQLIDEIQTGLPYVTLLGTTIRIAGSDGAQLNATFKLRAIEYTK